MDLIVAEKPSQAKAIAKALARRFLRTFYFGKRNKVVVYLIETDRGKAYVTSARGHILDTDFVPPIRNKPRTRVDPKFILTSARVTKFVREGSRNIINAIRKLAKEADRLIVATDYDREGENIGLQIATIARSANPRIEVKRAKFSAMTPEEIREAFKEENLRDLNLSLANASEARQESDLRVGAAMTRLLSVPIQKRGIRGIISYGPVQIPALGFVVEYYKRHLESKRRAKISYTIVAETPLGELAIDGKRDSKEGAERVMRVLPQELELVKFSRRERVKPRPLPLNTPKLAELANKYLGFPAKRTLELAEELYLAGYISYPRTETNKRSGEALRKAFRLAAQAASLLKAPRKPVKPRSGKRDDQAHPPIHPTRIVDPRKIRGDAGKLYELVLRHFLANFGPDARLSERTIVYRGGKRAFKSEKTFYVEPGRLAVYPYESVKPEPGNRPPERIPVRRYVARIVPPRIEPPITEAKLVRLMDEHGIGTDATFADHIAKLLERGYVRRSGKYLIPTELGLKVYEFLRSIDAEVVDPRIRAFMENEFRRVERGEITAEKAVSEIVERFLPVFERVRSELPKHERELAELVKGVNKKSRRKKRRMRFVYALDPFSISGDLNEAIEAALRYFDRAFGTDLANREKIEIAAYDYEDTHEYPEAAKRNAFVYLLKGSPNRGVVIARDRGRYFSISIDTIARHARIYVLSDSSRVDEFRSRAYKEFLSGVQFPKKEFALKHDGHEISVSLGYAYAHVRISPRVEVRNIGQWRPLEIVSDKSTRFYVPSFSVPFAVFDALGTEDPALLARLVREVYGF